MSKKIQIKKNITGSRTGDYANTIRRTLREHPDATDADLIAILDTVNAPEWRAQLAIALVRRELGLTNTT